MSSIAPLVSQEIAKELAKKDVEMLDAPVSGGQEKAQLGTLAIMVGGKEEVFKKCKTILEVMGKPVLVGDIGAGQTTKLVPYVIQTIAMGCLQADAEIVFKNWGRDDITQESLVDIIGIPGNESELVIYARDEGFNANICYLTMQDQKEIIYKDVPLVMKIKSNNVGALHVIVVFGYDPDGIIYHNPGIGANLKMSYLDYENLNANPSSSKKYIAVHIWPKDFSLNLTDIYL